MQEIVKKIKNAKNIGVFTHMNADPDALGSASAFLHVLKQLNKKGTLFLNEEFDFVFDFLKIDSFSLAPSNENFDLLISVDASTVNRLGVFCDMFKSHNNTIAIDHHASRTSFAKLEHVELLSSNCEIMLKLFRAMQVEITPLIATCLYTGLAGDTNCFRNGSTSVNSHKTAMQLFDLGANFKLVSTALFSSREIAHFEILKRVMNRAEFINHIAISYITEKDRIELNKEVFETSDLIDMLGTVKQVKISVLIKQTTGKNYRISLRSTKEYNVARFVERFGGGGHNQAAGMSLVGSLAQVKRLLLKELEKFEKSNN